MRKVLLMFSLLVFGLVLSSCTVGSGAKYKMLLPSGTPAIALSQYIDTHDLEANVVAGSDLLIAGFTQADYDFIVAPVNLGVKFYNQNADFQYVLYRPIVGCNYYILSTEVSSFTELDGKEITIFGRNATPGVMFSTLCKYYNIEPVVTYADSVADVNPLLVSGKAKTILTAEPSKSVIQGTGNYQIIDLALSWKEIAGTDLDVPQAGLFIKKSLIGKAELTKILNEIESSISYVVDHPAEGATLVAKIDSNLAKMNAEKLAQAIPNCNLLTHPLVKEEVTYYCQKVIEAGLAGTIGGKAPDEGFYY